MNFATLHVSTPQLMTSALIYIQDDNHKQIKCRALLDTCATANFITESMVNRLKLPVTMQSLSISAINGTSTESKGIVHITIQSIHDDFTKSLTCLTIPSITDFVPSETFPRNSVKIPRNIRLADPDFHLPQPVDLLIGSGATLSLFAVGQISLSNEKHDLYIQKTRLGWAIAGNATSQRPANPICHLTRLEKLISKFWKIEEVATNKSLSPEKIACEEHYQRTVSRNEDGRYIVRLPFRKINARLGDSRAIALKRLSALERKLNANSTLKIEYTKVIDEYINLNHMSEIEEPEDDGYYMPHHSVIKESSNTTRVRVVFDASAKTSNGTSLNDTLMVGPTVQDKLISHLLRFRSYNYVLTADIEKMYRQILVHDEDRRYQRILWRKNGKIKTFQLNTLTFGIASSPFLAIRTIQKLANDERSSYPRAAEVIESHLYVDDLLTGTETIDEARKLRDDIISLLALGGFSIRQWVSNDKRVINDLSMNALHENFALNTDRALKTLGVSWNTRDDGIYYSTNPIKNIGKITKRSILSEIAKIFDPLGLLGPIILYIKKIMQDVWRCGLQWDESVPQNIYTEWLEFIKQWEAMSRVSFPRKLLIENCQDVQLHGFCDASNVGYGACIYVRSTGVCGDTIVRLLCAKSRVAPLKTVTTPRSCARCFRFNAQVVEHKMGNLPIARVQEAIPFTNTGIDFCGPFYIKERKYKNRTRIKVYICIFVCMSIKAVHLELVSDLSSEGFIAALRRFIARRGMPAHIHSDNGSNFVGANNQLKELYALFNSEQHQTVLNKFVSDHKITWHFIPPAAPHFGGIRESMVKLFKHHFKRVVGDSLFTFEQLNTFITEVEGILNSRPITSLTSDPNDLLVLTPAHYLIGKPLTTLPEGDLSCVPVNRLSVWQHISKVRQDFWARWNLEYLNELQIRNKWTKDGPKLEAGSIVCIKDKNLPCNQWMLGRIVETHPGADGIVRAASIKTATGVIKRAARALCPLPIER